MNRIGVFARFLALAAGETAGAFGLSRLVTAPLGQLWRAIVVQRHQPVGGWTLDRLVVDAAACLACVVFAGLVTSSIATVVAASASPAHSWTRPSRLRVGVLQGPLWWRRAVLYACGLGLAAPVAASPSLAQHADPDGPCAARCPTSAFASSRLAGLQMPDLPDSSVTQRPRDSSLVVRPGDSLWLIAERLSAPVSSPVICRRVDALYAANRRTIGPDPDLIFPGTRLDKPGGTA